MAGNRMAGLKPFDQAARKVLSLAHQEAVATGYSKIGPGHLLLGLIQDEGEVGKILREQGADLETARRIVAEQTPASERPGRKPGQVDLSETTQKLLERVIGLVRQEQQSVIGSEHLLLALVELDDSHTQTILAESGLDRNVIREKVLQSLVAHPLSTELDDLLGTLKKFRHLLQTELTPTDEERLDRIEAILREYFGK